MAHREAGPSTYHIYHRGQWTAVAGPIVEESRVSIFVNGKELLTVMATPDQQDYLAVGFLFAEGLISHQEDLLSVGLAPNQTCVDVWLKDKELDLPQRPILTTGCGRGMTFGNSNHFSPLDSSLRVTHRQLADLMHELQERACLYRQARGIHAAGLATASAVVMVAEDVGRHNTLDKLAGRCLLEGVESADHILLTTGRISSEMMTKARRMEVPLVASLTSPTSLSVQRAEEWNITLVGYLRPERMQVYTHPERLREEISE
jgi:FdhD protein